MLEYTVEDAIALLTKNLNSAKESVEKTKTDMLFVREQITTLQVNSSRVYNWDVRERRRRMQQPAAVEAASAAAK